ncbi:MAG: hypothetical protein K6T16_03260 [Candidatus Pacearchaeota archaeon]|nr:hypothetical protein [Candidatus Pacearchaeota archaeon]
MAILKKTFFDVKLEIFESLVPLLAFRPEELENRVIKFDLTKILKGKGCEGKFIVRKTDSGLVGEMYEFRMQPSFIRHLIGRGTSIVEDSFVAKAQDTTLRVKPFMITRKKVHRSVRKALREGARDFIEKVFEDKTRAKIFQLVTSSVLQKKMAQRLKKTYPLAVCELRVVRVEKLK